MFQIFLALALQAQTPDPSLPPPDFQDPFGSPQTIEPSAPQAPSPTDSLPPLEAPPMTPPPSELPPPDESFAPPADSFAPPADPNLPPPNLPPLETSPQNLPIPAAPVPETPAFAPPPPPPAAVPLPTEAPRGKPFEFPQPNADGPVTEQVIESKKLEAATAPGDWALGVGLGSAVNLNRHVTQMAFDFTAGYRLDSNWEIGLLTFYRFVNVKYIGFLAQGRYQFRLTEVSKMRTELAFMGATGWAVRSKSNGFNEGRWPIRLESEILLYINPSWALTARTGLEAHLMGYANKTYTNFMKGKGMPTQLLLSAGCRFEF